MAVTIWKIRDPNSLGVIKCDNVVRNGEQFLRYRHRDGTVEERRPGGGASCKDKNGNPTGGPGKNKAGNANGRKKFDVGETFECDDETWEAYLLVDTRFEKVV